MNKRTNITDLDDQIQELRHIEVDVDRYKAMLDDPSLTDAQKEQIIVALWQIIVAFVDLGFGVHPAQQVCGKDENITGDSPQESADDVE